MQKAKHKQNILFNQQNTGLPDSFIFARVKKEIELLAPGGDIDGIKAAIIAGADAIYCGLEKFNARNRASNISFDQLKGVIRLAHQHNCEVFLTLNILILEVEIPALIKLLNKLVNTHLDGIIIQDLGLFYILNAYFPTLKIHASTQLTTHNAGQIKFLSHLGATRVNLSRELSLSEIKHLTSIAANHQVLTEVFIHGSQCISFSGICYMSSVTNGQSGNRGRCSQPCRDAYQQTAAGKTYPLNLKDNAAYSSIGELYDAGVYSLKIEGRIKKYDYIYTVVDTYKKQINNWIQHRKLQNEKETLYKVFNRDFSNSYLLGDINNMFIDNPRDHSIIHTQQKQNAITDVEKETAALQFYTEKDKLKQDIETKIEQVNINQIPINLSVSGENGKPLIIQIETPDKTFNIQSATPLSNHGAEALGYQMLFKRLKAINETDYYINKLDVNEITTKSYLPFKELNTLKTKLLYILNGHKNTIDPIIPEQLKSYATKSKANLSVIISSIDDIKITTNKDITLYFKLPSNLGNQLDKYIQFFKQYEYVIPWFPAVLIGTDYSLALDFIKQVAPTKLVTENTGIAYLAFKNSITWIAGPQINTTNSYALLTLKEKLNCAGAFISNELNKNAIAKIKKPKDFELHYSIYHPITLMTTRQCMLNQVSKCTKTKMDDACLTQCNKTTHITHNKGTSFIIDESKGNYNQLYNNINCLNTDIIANTQHLFDNFCVNLSDVATETKLAITKQEIVQLFDVLISEDTDTTEKLRQVIHPTTNHQYNNSSSI